MIVDAFARAFWAHHGDLVGRPVLIALSGGSDSVALLHLLCECRPRLGCRPAAAHIHHHLRGEAADTDAAMCVELCRTLGVALAVAHLDPRPPRGVSGEAWWRAERYRLLAGERERAGCAAVATAHTLNDQAETVLLKMLRGAGPRGVAGVRRRRDGVVRPLLDFTRADLRAWLRSRGVTWREDASNLSVDRPRTFLRHRVLPLLATAYPRVLEQLGVFAATLGDDEELLAATLAGTAAWPGVGQPVALAPVAALPPPLRRRWLLALADRLPLGEPPSRAQLAAFDGLLGGGQPAAIDLGRRWVLRRRGESLHLSPPPLAAFAPIATSVQGTVTLPSGLVARLGAEPGGARFTARLSDRVRGAGLRWRPLRPGERSPGSAGRSLVRLLAAAGVPPEWRQAWPALEADGTMIWVPGLKPQAGWGADDEPGVGVELEVPW
jgi:tRNA(Ile)-lysidine synthase